MNDVSRLVIPTASVLAVGALVAGCTADQSPDQDQPESADERVPTVEHQTAEQWAHLTTVHEETGMTLLEGPVIAPDGRLYLTDVTAPSGEGKVLALEREEPEAEPELIYTDVSSALTSAQFSPDDGRLYLTDFAGGRILSVTAEGEEMEVFFSGEVEGLRMSPDDISFDEEGNLYITDSSGYDDPYWDPSGRVIRIDAQGEDITVLADELPAPNGIAFTPEFDGLWVSHNTSNQIDYFSLSQDGTELESAHPAIQVDAGQAQVDSLAVDAEGNLYVGHHNRAAVLVFTPEGELAQTIEADHETSETDVSSATNIAIDEGTTDGYMTVSGDSGGYVYTFEALAQGIRQSNGG